MRSTRLSLVRGISLVLVSLVVGCTAPSGEPSLPSWDDFLAAVTVEPDTGVYVVNGDEIIEDEAGLRAFFERWIAEVARYWAARDPSSEVGAATEPLIANRIGTQADLWSPAAARNLTYCVSRSSFGSRYQTVVDAMAEATAAWESAANVDFIHLVAEDDRCTAYNTNVVFDVRRTLYWGYVARAFFPSTSRSRRNVMISFTAFGNLQPLTLAGVLRHELGHVLGFRHEHTRPEAGTCFEDDSWIPLTPYENDSVMHYPQCNGANQGDLVLTALDIEGARSAYP